MDSIIIVTTFSQFINAINLQYTKKIKDANLYIKKGAINTKILENSYLRKELKELYKYIYTYDEVKDIPRKFKYDKLVYYSDVGAEIEIIKSFDFQRLILIEEGTATYIKTICESLILKIKYFIKGYSCSIGSSKIHKDIFVYKKEWLEKNRFNKNHERTRIHQYKYKYNQIVEFFYPHLIQSYGIKQHYLNKIENSKLLLISYDNECNSFIDDIKYIFDQFDFVLFKAHPSTNINIEIPKGKNILFVENDIPIDLIIIKLNKNNNSLYTYDYGTSVIMYYFDFFSSITDIKQESIWSERILALKREGLYE